MGMYWVASLRLLNGTFHGTRGGGEAEWPPSPLRVFQALVRAAASGPVLGERERQALLWLERQPAPLIVAPVAEHGRGCVLSVPHNAMDVVAKAWSHGNLSNKGNASPATHRALKRVRPTWVPSEEVLAYAWPIPEGDEAAGRHDDTLAAVAERVVALGWGIDLATGTAGLFDEAHLQGLTGERWVPCASARELTLRVPVPGSLEDLERRHESFRRRLGRDGTLIPPRPLGAFAMLGYRRAEEPEPSDVAAFALYRSDRDEFRPFPTARRALTVAGMLRHAVSTAAKNARWTEADRAEITLGHVTDGIEPGAARRFLYLPLPSQERRRSNGPAHVGDVRRVLVAARPGLGAEIEWLRNALVAAELVDEASGAPVALLSPLPPADRGLAPYLRPATSWATVTPVVLPGHDDPAHYRRRLARGIGSDEQKRLLAKLEARVEGLLRKAIVQAGYPRPLAQSADLEWSTGGFLPGVDLASRYGVPDHLGRFPRRHVRIRWRRPDGSPLPVAGPLCLGGGRFHGLGLFCGTDS